MSKFLRKRIRTNAQRDIWFQIKQGENDGKELVEKQKEGSKPQYEVGRPPTGK